MSLRSGVRVPSYSQTPRVPRSEVCSFPLDRVSPHGALSGKGLGVQPRKDPHPQGSQLFGGS